MSQISEFYPHTLPTGVESTQFFNQPYLPGWVESTLFGFWNLKNSQNTRYGKKRAMPPFT